MLLEQKAKQGDIVAVKIISGEELIGRLDTENPLKLIKPLVLGMQQQQNPETGEIEVGMAWAPFMLSVSDNGSITLADGSYITFIKVRDEIKQAYIKSTTGLAVPPSLIT